MTHFYAISSNILLRCALHAAFGSVFLLFKHHFFLPSSHTAFGSGFWKFVQFHFSTFTNRDKTLLKAISLNILLLCALHAAFGSVFLVWKLHFFLLHYCTFRILKRFQQRFLYSKTRCFFGFKPLWKAIFQPEYQFYLSKMGFRTAVFAHNFCNKFTFRIKVGAFDMSKIRVSILG